MAGQPKRQALVDTLNARRNAYYDIDPVDVAIGAQQVPSTLEYVCAWIEDGNTVKALAEAVSADSKRDFTYAQLVAYLRDSFGDSAERLIAEARTRASHCYAEDALTIADGKAETSVDVARAGNRIRARQWTAERWNRQAYGQAKDVSVSINLTTLHIDALRANTAQIVTVAPPVAIQALPPASE